jgi:cell division protein FtsL
VSRGRGRRVMRRRSGGALFCVLLLGLTLGALGHVAVQAQKNEVAAQLGREQAVYEALVTERRHRQIEIGRLKNPGRLVDLARARLGMTPQPAGIRVVRPPPGSGRAGQGGRR